MNIQGVKNPNATLESLGITNTATQFWNLSPEELTQHTLDLKQGTLNDTGALVINTGEFTGRSPKDKFIVKDAKTEHSVNWNNFNIPFEPAKFDALYDKVTNYLAEKNVYV